MRQSIGMLVTGSLFALLGMVLFTLSKIVVIAYILLHYSESCDQPLRVWSWGLLFLDLISLCLLVETLLRTHRLRERAGQEVSAMTRNTDCCSRL